MQHHRHCLFGFCFFQRHAHKCITTYYVVSSAEFPPRIDELLQVSNIEPPGAVILIHDNMRYLFVVNEFAQLPRGTGKVACRFFGFE